MSDTFHNHLMLSLCAVCKGVHTITVEHAIKPSPPSGSNSPESLSSLYVHVSQIGGPGPKCDPPVPTILAARPQCTPSPAWTTPARRPPGFAQPRAWASKITQTSVFQQFPAYSSLPFEIKGCGEIELLHIIADLYNIPKPYHESCIFSNDFCKIINICAV